MQNKACHEVLKTVKATTLIHKHCMSSHTRQEVCGKGQRDTDTDAFSFSSLCRIVSDYSSLLACFERHGHINLLQGQ